jgi:L-iditol 2-dehydrogenase
VDRVLVLGLGVMGLLFAQLLPRYTTAQRAAAGRRDSTNELARRFGLQPVWDMREHALDEQVALAERFDCVIECTGKLDGWQQAFARTAPGGQVLLFGGLPRDTLFSVDSYRLHYEEIRVLGSFHFSPRDVAKAREFLLSGGLELEPLISGCLPLGKLEEVMRLLESRQGMQYAVDPWA